MIVRIGRARVDAEMVGDILGQAKGLMFRKSMPRNGGMLFVFPYDGRHSIWMFRMRFPIDIIWIDSKKRVVDIKWNAKPCLLFCIPYFPRRPAKYVLEVNAGFARKKGIRIGSRVSIARASPVKIRQQF
jgi:uncharacterized membrane protein (UPF0127 family)